MRNCENNESRAYVALPSTYIVIFGQAKQIRRLHLQKVMDGGLSYVHHVGSKSSGNTSKQGQYRTINGITRKRDDKNRNGTATSNESESARERATRSCGSKKCLTGVRSTHCRSGII